MQRAVSQIAVCGGYTVYMVCCSARHKKIFLAVLVLLVLLLFFLPQHAYALDLGEELTKVFNLLFGWFMKGLELILALFQVFVFENY